MTECKAASPAPENMFSALPYFYFSLNPREETLVGENPLENIAGSTHYHSRWSRS